MMQGGAAVCTSALGAPHHMDMDMDMDMGTALHAFEATEATHIALSCGQRVRIIEERDDGWSYGEAETGERGTFPTSYVQLDGLDGAHAEMSFARKLPRSDSFTTIASRRASLPNILAMSSFILIRASLLAVHLLHPVHLLGVSRPHRVQMSSFMQ